MNRTVGPYDMDGRFDTSSSFYGQTDPGRFDGFDEYGDPDGVPLDEGLPPDIGVIQEMAQYLRTIIGERVVCEFLMGTGGLVRKHGILYRVGQNFVTLYNEEYRMYVVCDLYSLKFVTILGAGGSAELMNGGSR